MTCVFKTRLLVNGFREQSLHVEKVSLLCQTVFCNLPCMIFTKSGLALSQQCQRFPPVVYALPQNKNFIVVQLSYRFVV